MATEASVLHTQQRHTFTSCTRDQRTPQPAHLERLQQPLQGCETAPREGKDGYLQPRGAVLELRHLANIIRRHLDLHLVWRRYVQRRLAPMKLCGQRRSAREVVVLQLQPEKAEQEGQANYRKQ